MATKNKRLDYIKDINTYLVACASSQTYIINAESEEKAIRQANKISDWMHGVELQHPTAYLIKDYVGDNVLDVSEMIGIPNYEIEIINSN